MSQMRRLGRVGQRAGDAVAAFADAAGSGRFFTLWSALASFAVAVVLLVPVLPRGLDGYAHGMAASAVGWSVLAIPVLAVAAAERRIPRRLARIVMVSAALVGVAVARPFVNDAVVLSMFDIESDGQLVSRVGTNLLVVVLLFSFVAVITTQDRTARTISAHLALALARSHAARRELDDEEQENVRLVQATVDELRAARDRLLEGRIDFEAVRDYSALVRAASHRLDHLSEKPAPVPVLDEGVVAPDPPRPRLVDALVPTPFLLVGLVFAFVCAPFALARGGVLVLAAALGCIVVIDLLAGWLLRVRPDRRGRPAARAFVLAWTGGGAISATVAAALLPGSGLLLVVPMCALPLTAVVIAVALDARRRVRAEERASTDRLAGAARDLADRMRAAREPLRHAAGTLHGRVQGRCVIFAAMVDEAPPAEAAVDRFRAETDAALDEVLRPAADPAVGVVDELGRTLAGWQPLLQLDTRVSPEAVGLLSEHGAVSVVAELVNEGLVNAVKHSDARAARIDVTVEPGGVRVRVASPGELPRPVMSTRRFGGRALLYQDAEGVVLESTVSPAGILTPSA
ncbi:MULTISPECIES: ATPase [unclassified Microbacterium]|uniref:ATPase n=1 Tax=unclassified Microbacterium TaxID=2609290 RepID=UPI003018FAC5